MADVHKGSWFGLPDFGITEALQGKQTTTPSPTGLAYSSGAPMANPVGSISNKNDLTLNPNNTPGLTVNKGILGSTDTQAPAGGSTSRIDQLNNYRNNGGLNPSQQTEYDQLMASINAGGAQDQQLINEAYGASAGYLDKAEGALRSDFPTILQEIEAQKAAAIRMADSGKASTLGTINEQQITADQRNNSVMADARRLYDELSRGYQQRFGGASSAGQAASEISNVERQRQQGKIQQDYGNTVRQIEQARTQVETKYQDQIYQLEQTTNQAKNEANRDFQNKLLQINQSRAENEQNKAQARLAALQDLRNKVYQINLQNMQFQQTLQAQKQQADASIADYTSQLSGLGQSAQTATSGFTPGVSSNLQTSTNTGNTSTNPYIGPIGNRKEDLTGLLLPGRRQDILA